MSTYQLTRWDKLGARQIEGDTFVSLSDLTANLRADAMGLLGRKTTYGLMAAVALVDLADDLEDHRETSGAHVERRTRLRDGKTYCACGAPWPCPRRTT
jgi:hypothetical protein